MTIGGQPLVCICIPTFNAEKTIGATLESLLRQTYRNLEIHVVDNNSTDRTLAIVEEVGGDHVSIHRHDVNVGSEGNFTRCIEVAGGDFAAIFHADDIYYPEMVERQVHFLVENSSAGGVFTQADLIDAKGNLVGGTRKPGELNSDRQVYEFGEVFRAVLSRSNFLICPSFMARTNVYKDVGSWRGELFRSSADLDVWFRILKMRPCGILPDRLMGYRISVDQGTAVVRLSDERSHFFLVMDHYLRCDGIRSTLTERDLENLERLERRDVAMRSANALIQGKVVEAKCYSSRALSLAGLVDALSSRRGFFVFVLALGVNAGSRGWLVELARPVLWRLKSVFNK